MQIAYDLIEYLEKEEDLSSPPENLAPIVKGLANKFGDYSWRKDLTKLATGYLEGSWNGSMTTKDLKKLGFNGNIAVSFLTWLNNS